MREDRVDVEESIKRLKQSGYSDKAIKEILELYGLGEDAPRVKLREIWSYHLEIGRFSIFIGIGEVLNSDPYVEDKLFRNRSMKNLHIKIEASIMMGASTKRMQSLIAGS